MTTDIFSKPEPEAYFKAAEHIGETVAFMGISYVDEITTQFGETDAVEVDLIIVLNEALNEIQGEAMTGLVFNGGIVKRLKKHEVRVGQIVTYETKLGEGYGFEPLDDTKALKALNAWAKKNLRNGDKGWEFITSEEPF